MNKITNMENILPDMLSKYNDNNHSAIIETFIETVKNDWYSKSLNYFLRQGLGISEIADNTINQYLIMYPNK